MNKNIVYFGVFLCFLSLVVQLSASEKNYDRQKKTKTKVPSTSQFIPIDSTLYYSISVNGNVNTIKINSTTKDDQSATKGTEGTKIVTINGEGNSVKINDRNEGKVRVKQNGNNNTVKISQSSHQP
jgi:hypothetical protein